MRVILLNYIYLEWIIFDVYQILKMNQKKTSVLYQIKVKLI